MSDPRNLVAGNYLLNFIYNCARWLVIIAATVMVSAAILQATSRHIVGIPMGWSDELARATLVWTVFISVAVLASQRRLLRVDALLIALPLRAQYFMSAVIHLISVVFLGWMFVLSIFLVQLAGGQVTAALRIPYAFVYLSFPVGLFGATLFSFVHLLTDIQNVISGPSDDADQPESLIKEDVL